MEYKGFLISITDLDKTLIRFNELKSVKPPAKGWINLIRTSINITAKRIGEKFKTPVSAQAIIELEKSEEMGNISIKKLKDFAEAMDLEFVYGFAPKDKSFYSKIYPVMKDKVNAEYTETPYHIRQTSKGDSNQSARKNMAIRLVDKLPKSFWNDK